MLNQIKIQNFKSIRELEFSAKRINVFIGEPNTGKSNILEALSLFSADFLKGAREIVRFTEAADLFFDQRVTKDISVQTDNWRAVLQFKPPGSFQYNLFWRTSDGNTEVSKASMQTDHRFTLMTANWSSELEKVRYYRFKSAATFPNDSPGVLNSPIGDNLVSVLYSNEDINKQVKALFLSKGFRLQFKPTEKQLFLSKIVNDEIYSYPWETVSETMRRIVFYMAVLETNTNSVLLLDEPEANTFPFYTAYLAERIALDQTNQFFLTTHNPYILSSIVNKAPVKDLAVFVVSMEDYGTKARQASEEGLSKILEYGPDAFLNLDKLVEG